MPKDRGITKSASNLHLDCSSILKYMIELAMERANPTLSKISVEGHGSRFSAAAVVNTQRSAHPRPE